MEKECIVIIITNINPKISLHRKGSNLHVETAENTGAVIGKQSDNNTTFRIDNYIAKNIYNEDTMTTTGGSIGISPGGKPRIMSRHILDFIFYQQTNKKNIFKKLLIKMEKNLKD